MNMRAKPFILANGCCRHRAPRLLPQLRCCNASCPLPRAAHHQHVGSKVWAMRLHQSMATCIVIDVQSEGPELAPMTSKDVASFVVAFREWPFGSELGSMALF